MPQSLFLCVCNALCLYFIMNVLLSFQHRIILEHQHKINAHRAQKHQHGIQTVIWRRLILAARSMLHRFEPLQISADQCTLIRLIHPIRLLGHINICHKVRGFILDTSGKPERRRRALLPHSHTEIRRKLDIYLSVGRHKSLEICHSQTHFEGDGRIKRRNEVLQREQFVGTQSEILPNLFQRERELGDIDSDRNSKLRVVFAVCIRHILLLLLHIWICFFSGNDEIDVDGQTHRHCHWIHNIDVFGICQCCDTVLIGTEDTANELRGGAISAMLLNESFVWITGRATLR
mmetsp:Transcript_30758/g.49339  ORF Transcript_30758/g.49339 Transcript_30758/m.49339 type:complete len:290 (+) Transcript_30758:266-1135(+)